MHLTHAQIIGAGLFYWSINAQGPATVLTAISVGRGFTFFLLLQAAGALQVLRQSLGVIIGSARGVVSLFFAMFFLGETFFTVFEVWIGHSSVPTEPAVFKAGFAFFTAAYAVAIVQVFYWVCGGTADDSKR